MYDLAMTIPGNKILTRRLQLRKIEQLDVPMISSWSCSLDAHGEYLTPEFLSKEEALYQLQSGRFWNDRSKTFIITLKDDPLLPIGTIHYWLRPEKKEIAVMALKIADTAQRNKGYATEAQKFLLIYLFDRLKLTAVDMYTDINNKSQQRCLHKLGFEIIDSLTYDDQQVSRTGHLFRLEKEQYRNLSIYQYHYE